MGEDNEESDSRIRFSGMDDMTADGSTPLKVLEKAEDDTKAGNYFVANYPPFSFWSQEETPSCLDQLRQPPQAGTPLGLYVHIPFCRKRCHFCYFRVYTDKNSKEIRSYLDGVITELARYAAMPAFENRLPSFVYFGGGTPSYLSAEQLTYFFDGLKAQMPWDHVEEVAFECEPGTLNRKKLETLKSLGVTRLSLGIENFDDHVLELNNRAHLSKQVHIAYNDARDVGFDQINIDLISGMLGETEANWKTCVEKTLEMAPECVTIYQMEIPFNTTIYKQMKSDGNDIAPVASWSTKRRWVSEAFDALEQAGYNIGSAYTAVKDKARTKFLYRDELWRGADLLGVGVASFSHVNGFHFQNQHHIEPYLESLAAGDLPIHRAMATTAEHRLIREFVLQMKLGRLERQYFIDKFDVDPWDRFGDELRTLSTAGRIELTDEAILVPRATLLEIDRMLWGFFLPEHQDARYA